MDDMLAFADEYGQPNLDTNIDNVSTHYIVAAVIVERLKTDSLRSVLDAVRARHFQTGPMKSTNIGGNDKRRIRVLGDLQAAGIHGLALVVDKDLIHEDSGLRFLIHDRDSKFSKAFDKFFRRPDGGIVRTPYQAPVANCYIESWIGSLKRECLNSFFCFSLRQLDYIVQTYALYHNQYRPHQGLGNRPLGVPEGHSRQVRELNVGQIRCKEWLGGMLKHYYRQAA